MNNSGRTVHWLATLLGLGAIAASSGSWAATIVIGSRDSTQTVSFSDTSAFSDAAISGTTVFGIFGNSGDMLNLGYLEPHGATGVSTSVSGPFTVFASAPTIGSPNDTYPISVTATGSPSIGNLTISSNLGVNVAPVGAINTLNTGISSGYNYLEQIYNPVANQDTGNPFSVTFDIAGNYSGIGVGSGMHQVLSLNSNWTVTQNFVFNGTDTVFAANINDYQPSLDQIDLEYKIYGSPVPLPAAVWLMLSGLGGVGALARKKRPA